MLIKVFGLKVAVFGYTSEMLNFKLPIFVTLFRRFSSFPSILTEADVLRVELLTHWIGANGFLPQLC